MKQFLGFDPLIFLEIEPYSHSHRQATSDELMIQISDYLAIRFIESLPASELANITSQSELFEIAKKEIPDFNIKVEQFLNDFKAEFQKNLK